MTKAEQFFYDNAGWSYDPKTETSEQGKERGAVRLADAELHAKTKSWYVDWEHETESPIDVFGKPDPVNGPFYNPRATFWCAILRDKSGDVLGSLGMIESPSAKYRRVVNAELALDAMSPEDFADYIPAGDIPFAA